MKFIVVKYNKITKELQYVDNDWHFTNDINKAHKHPKKTFAEGVIKYFEWKNANIDIEFLIKEVEEKAV